MKNYNIQYLRENNLIIFEGLGGSHAYGTSLPTSDFDIRGVFIQPLDDILSYGYVDQVTDATNDVIFYELKRFLELVEKNNPNILEILNLPIDCVIYKDPIFDLITNHKNKFISKLCKMTFADSAIQQIKKARSYNKKINWEESQMTRKSVIDFCYVLNEGGSMPFIKWVNIHFPGASQKAFGLVNIDHAHDLYALYYMIDPSYGIVWNEETANDVQLTSIPKEQSVDAYLTFNKDAYSSHCKKFKEYKEWLDNRNEDRFKMNKEHGKNYDSKNLLHVFRLLKMSLDIATKNKIIVRRPLEEIEKLMKIRKGEYELDDLINEAELMISILDKTFEDSSLPDKVDKDLVPNLLLEIRNKWYFETKTLIIKK